MLKFRLFEGVEKSNISNEKRYAAHRQISELCSLFGRLKLVPFDEGALCSAPHFLLVAQPSPDFFFWDEAITPGIPHITASLVYFTNSL